MSAKSEIIIKNITQAAQIFGLATNINIIPKTATKMVYNSNKTRDNLLIIGRSSSICISTTDMPTLSRTGLGNLMIKNGNVTRITKL